MYFTVLLYDFHIWKRRKKKFHRTIWAQAITQKTNHSRTHPAEVSFCAIIKPTATSVLNDDKNY